LSLSLLVSFASCIDADESYTSKEQSAEHSTPPKGEKYVLAKTEESALKDGKKQITFFANTIKPIKSNDATKQYFLTLSDYLKGVWNEYDVINIVLSESKDNDVVNSYASYCDVRRVEYSRSLSTRNGKTVNYMYKDNAEGALTENTNDKLEYAQFMFSLFTFLFPEISITMSTSPPTTSFHQEYYILSIDGLEITCSNSSYKVTVHLSDNETFSLSLDADVDVSLEPIISNP